MGNIIEVTDDTFKATVLQNTKPVLIDFWADWCRPCLQLLTVLEDIAEEYQNYVIVAKINVDENPDTPLEYGIRSIPYLILFRDGEVIDTLIGAQSKDKLEYFIESNLV